MIGKLKKHPVWLDDLLEIMFAITLGLAAGVYIFGPMFIATIIHLPR